MAEQYSYPRSSRGPSTVRALRHHHTPGLSRGRRFVSELDSGAEAPRRANADPGEVVQGGRAGAMFSSLGFRPSSATPSGARPQFFPPWETMRERMGRSDGLTADLVVLGCSPREAVYPVRFRVVPLG